MPDLSVPVTHHRTEPCPACGVKNIKRSLDAMDGMSAEMREWTFDNTGRFPANAAAYDAALAASKSPSWFLTLTGPVGVGKTRLLACIINGYKQSGVPAVYTVTADLLDHLRTTFAPNAEVEFDKLWERYLSVPVLALDELDRFNATDWAKEKFHQLADHRYRNGREMLTVFATNSPLDALPNYLVSRMADKRCKTCAIIAPDIRRIRD